MSKPVVDIDRVERRLDALWGIGRTGRGGVTRLAFSVEEREAIDYLCNEIPSHYHLDMDAVGNVFATPDPDAEHSVFLGSHLDTVNNGGRLDGALGVVAALEAIELFEPMAETSGQSPTVAIFRGEESTRFGSGTIGSRRALGLLDEDDLELVDSAGISLREAIQAAGYQVPSDLTTPTLALDRISGFLEMHIEQGPVLETAGVDLGIVTSIRAPVRYELTVTGSYGHSGAVPMRLRHDALACAAEMIIRVESLAATPDSDEATVVATVGDISPRDGAINKICGDVSFPIDIRSDSLDTRDAFEAHLIRTLRSIADRRGVTMTEQSFYRQPPVELDTAIVDALSECAKAVSASFDRLPSGGGHDARTFQRQGIPAGMVFVPSLGGMSHTPHEETTASAIESAIEVLVRFLRVHHDQGDC